MPPSWIVIRCLPGRVGAVAGGGALEDCGPKVHDGVAKRIDIPRQMFPRPNPPQLPNLRWWPNKKMCTRAPKIRLHFQATCGWPRQKVSPWRLLITKSIAACCGGSKVAGK